VRGSMLGARRAPTWGAVVGASLALAAGAAAMDARATFTAPPPLVPSARLQLLQETGGMARAAESPRAAAPKGTIYRAALLSALVPGLGEYVSGHRTRALISGAAEAGIWTSFITFKVQEDLRSDRAREYAFAFAGARPGGDEDYFKAMSLFVRAEGPGQWNEFVRRRSRDTGEVVGREYFGDEAWAWTSIERFIEYRQLRRGMLSADDHAKNAIAFAIANRIVSIVSTVQAIRSDSHHAEEGGLGLRLEFGGPGAAPGACLGLVNRF